ncbi:MAG: sodium-translocating pyrophosphatase [Bdellovibrionota bacterium]
MALAEGGSERSLASVPCWWWSVPILGALALVMAFYFYKSIMKAPEGNDRMKEIAGYVREGAYAYLRRQYKVVAIVIVVLSILLAFMAFVLHVQHPLVPFAFITGAFFSALSGFIGMKTATAASARTAQGASESLNKGLTIAFRAGAVMGLTVVGLALADIAMWFLYLYLGHHRLFGGDPMNLETITVVMLCFGMGASTQALFARVGGGIYTKAADVGADLVGKVEAGIPEDDPRNPAVIADNVGDNVGDVAGMGADLYESYAGAILSSAALGVAAVSIAAGSFEDAFKYLTAPMLIAAAGILASIIGIFVVRTKEDASMKTLLWALNRGIYLSSVLIVIFAFAVVHFLALPMGVFWSILIGLLLGIIIGKGTELATAAEYRATQFVASQTETGPATVVIAGIAEGMMSTWIPVVGVCLGTLLSFGAMGGFGSGDTALVDGLYGIAMAAVAMLSTLGLTLATDAYGPIADNAGGNAEMAGLPAEVRQRTDALDSLGNTTAAIGKGFAIGSAALTALALLASYVEEVRIGLHREAAVVYEVPAGAEYATKDLGYGKYGIYFAGAEGSSKEAYTISAFASDTDKAFDIEVDGKTVSVIANQKGERVKNQALLQTSGVASLPDYMDYYGVTLINPKIIVGAFLGVLLVFVFCAMTLKAVGKAAYDMVTEVRRQFAEHKGIMDGSEKPDYARCVAISTAGAQRAMIIPSLVAIVVPIVVGLVLGVGAVLGLLVGGLTGGFCMAVFMANAGGAWDNAKKYIEAGNFGGKGSIQHKAAVVGDTVGDPFKDTSGPSLNILMKLMTMVSIVFAGLIVKYSPQISSFFGM